MFFDRDDTLIACRAVTSDGDLGDPALVSLLPGVREACESLRRAGWALVVITNQGGVARGKFGIAEVERVNRRVNELLGGAIEAFRFCPCHPLGSVAEFAHEHPWRKPEPGMILDAAAALGLDLGRSWTVGDSGRDAEAGRRAGTRTILIGQAESAGTGEAAEYFARDVADAASIILRESRA